MHVLVLLVLPLVLPIAPGFSNAFFRNVRQRRRETPLRSATVVSPHPGVGPADKQLQEQTQAPEDQQRQRWRQAHQAIGLVSHDGPTDDIQNTKGARSGVQKGGGFNRFGMEVRKLFSRNLGHPLDDVGSVYCAVSTIQMFR